MDALGLVQQKVDFPLDRQRPAVKSDFIRLRIDQHRQSIDTLPVHLDAPVEDDVFAFTPRSHPRRRKHFL
jgi:hypothetical protein